MVQPKTITSIRQYRTSMKDVRIAVRSMFEQALPRIIAPVLSMGDNPNRDVLLRVVGDEVQKLFTDGRQAFGMDGFTPITPFATLLTGFYVRVVVESVTQQTKWMQQNIPDDVYRFLAAAPRSTLEATNFLRQPGESDEAYRQRVDDLRLFRPNPLAELDPQRRWVPMQRWNTPDGYQLSDRIWRAGVETRKKIDDILIAGLNEGLSSTELASELESLLLPGRRSRRTKKPYNRDASYDAMRLARTEISRAANHASFTAAYLNPYVNHMDVARSPNGDPDCKICPQHATIGINGERLRAPYSIHSADLPVYHPHCMCHSRPVVADSPEEITRRLRAVIRDARLAPFPTPAQPEDFASLLLQGVGRILIARTVQQLLFGESNF